MRFLSPVVRFLGTSDLGRAVGFYRDVLGFEIHVNEARSGPVRICFTSHDYAPDDTNTPREIGSAIVFLSCDNVVAAREWIRGRGGRVGELERINGIKMEVFQVEDPDGHALWIGQSYEQPAAGTAAALLEKALPEFPCSDVGAASKYYCEVLGFRVNYEQDDIAVMYRDEVTILLIARDRASFGSCYVYVADADELYRELAGKGANLQGEPVSHPWGLRDFKVLDLEGNRIIFGQPFE